LFAYILGNGGGNVFLIAVQGDRVTDVDQLQNLCFSEFLLIDTISVTLIGAEVINDLLGALSFLLVCQLVNGSLSIHIRYKSEALVIIFRDKHIIVILIQDNTEIIDNRIAI